MPALTGKGLTNNTSTATYTIPAAGLDVETVYAAIDTTGAGGAVTAELTITDQSGAVIARKTQGTTIPAGGTGSATWALRLDDEGSSGGGTDPLAVHFNTDPQSNSFLTVTTTQTPLATKIESTGGGAIEIAASGSASTATVDITSTAQLNLVGDGIVAKIGNGNDFYLQNHSAGTLIDVRDNGTFEFHLGNTRTLFVYDHLGNPIFEVRDDGSIHGLAAVGAITWDL